MCENCFPMCFFEGGNLKVKLSRSLKGVKHRNDTSIVDGDQEGVKCYLFFVLKDQVKKDIGKHIGKQFSHITKCHLLQKSI